MESFDRDSMSIIDSYVWSYDMHEQFEPTLMYINSKKEEIDEMIDEDKKVTDYDDEDDLIGSFYYSCDAFDLADIDGRIEVEYAYLGTLDPTTKEYQDIARKVRREFQDIRDDAVSEFFS